MGTTEILAVMFLVDCQQYSAFSLCMRLALIINYSLATISRFIVYENVGFSSKVRLQCPCVKLKLNK